MKLLFLLLPFFLLAALLLILCGCIRNEMGKAPDPEKYDALPNRKNGRFQNEEPIRLDRKKAAASKGMLRFLFSSENAPAFPLPFRKAGPEQWTEKNENSITWLGHASVLIELDGIRILADPVFGNAAPIPGIVRRYAPPPIPREEMPEVDFILITHDHYDHLEYDTIRFYRDKKTPFITASGVGARLTGWGIPESRIRELNWEESVHAGPLKITAHTSRHFSGRSTKDRDTTLWAAFSIAGKTRKIFLGGDGGYGKHFKRIGTMHGPFDLVLLEIDAWNERWPDNHMRPEQTIQAFRDLRGRMLMPIHWGVFDLAMHPWRESIRKTAGLAEKQGIPLHTPLPGERSIPGKTPVRNWWDDESPRQ